MVDVCIAQRQHMRKVRAPKGRVPGNPGQGDLKESATEINRLPSWKVRVKGE